MPKEGGPQGIPEAEKTKHREKEGTGKNKTGIKQTNKKTP